MSPTKRQGFRRTATEKQARAYWRRQRRLSLRAPQLGVNPTHTFPKGNLIDIADSFAGLGLLDMTFHCRVQAKIPTGFGLLFEFSGEYSGLAVWIHEGTRLGVCCGNPQVVLGPPDNIAEGLQPFTEFLTPIGSCPFDEPLDIVVALRPGTGSVRAWVNGELVGCSNAGLETFKSDSWGGSNDDWWGGGVQGSYFETPKNDEVIWRATRRQEPSGIDQLSDLTVYACKRPRAFGTCAVDDPYVFEQPAPT